jgi:hypothetical protein
MTGLHAVANLSLIGSYSMIKYCTRHTYQHHTVYTGSEEVAKSARLVISICEKNTQGMKLNAATLLIILKTAAGFICSRFSGKASHLTCRRATYSVRVISILSQNKFSSVCCSSN